MQPQYVYLIIVQLINWCLWNYCTVNIDNRKHIDKFLNADEAAATGAMHSLSIDADNNSSSKKFHAETFNMFPLIV